MGSNLSHNLGGVVVGGGGSTLEEARSHKVICEETTGFSKDGRHHLELFTGLLEVTILFDTFDGVLIDDLLNLISVDGLGLQLSDLLVSHGNEGFEDLLEIGGLGLGVGDVG